MSSLEILVEPVAFGNKLDIADYWRQYPWCMLEMQDEKTYVLLPLSEPCFLRLDLLREALAQLLLLFLELGVLHLANFGLTELASLHLSLAVILVVVFLSG